MATLADNRRARFDYEILENYTAGIALTGQEVKSAKAGGMTLTGSFVTFYRGNPMLTGAAIAPYGPAGPLPTYEKTRSRRLLLRKREIEELRGKISVKGLTIVPLKVYTHNHLIKVEIALCRGKRDVDKRAAIKRRDVAREIRKSADRV